MKDLRKVGYQTDQAMKMTWLCLCDDFGISECQPMRASIARGDIRQARSFISEFRRTYSVSADKFKKTQQLLDWAKRYRFANDLFSDEDLRMMSWSKYSDTQSRIAQPIPVSVFYRSGLVSRWRRIARTILGEYTESEHFERCRFAKNACFGHPAKRKGLDQKLKGPITGSTEHISFLHRYCETDPTLWNILHTSNCSIRPAPSLRLTFVPKSYKALRAIMPDTLAGSFYSSGLGEMFKRRLLKAGLNINTLQNRHRRLAMRASSVSGWRNCNISSRARLATLDLSSASDSVTTQLLSMILPRKWFHAVIKGRVSYFLYEGKRYRLSSACTMGLGHTFPLETLVFYVLTKGVAEWHGPGYSQVSVYGDDIIVPTEVFTGTDTIPSLESIFRLLHLQINPEKSFWGWCDFRESCGGDFYRGHDVRPASPEASSCTLQLLPYVAFLYKLGNSLLRRWSPYSIETTLAWISSEVYRLIGEVHVVPSFFPDTSGLKVHPGDYFTQEPELVNFGSYVVSYLSEVKPLRQVLYELPYLWDSLRVKSTRGPYSFNIKEYEIPVGLRTKRARIRFRDHYRTIMVLTVSDAAKSCSYKPAKSVCPYWAMPDRGRRA